MSHMWLYVAMTRMRIAELKNNLSRVLRLVERGETVEVLDRDRAIARIVPIAEPRLHVRAPKRAFAEIRDKSYPPSKLPYDVVEVLLEDRGKR